MAKTERKFVEEGLRLKNFRKNTLKLSAVDFSAELEISTKYLSMLETGERQASARILKALTSKYGLPAEAITTGRQYEGALKVKAGDTLSLEVKVARLDARVEQLERLLVEVLQTKTIKDV